MLMLCTAILFALQQGAPPPQAPQTTFRSEVDRVAVDVIVVDDAGRPVTDLAPEDFTLDVDGKRRRIASAEFISLRQLVDPGPPPAHYATNAGSRAGRLIMLVIDQNNIKAGTGRTVMEAAAKFLGTLNPADRVGLHLMPGAGPVLDFTSNHALVAQVLKQAVGRGPSVPHGLRLGVSEAKAILRNDRGTLREVLERECAGNLSEDEFQVCQRMVINDARMLSGEMRSRTAESLVGLRELMRRLRAGRSRKTVVLLSEGLVLDRGAEELAWVPAAAAEAQITLYVLRMESSPFEAGSARVSPSRSADQALEREGLDLLAGFAGGAVVPLSPSNPWLGFSRVSTEVSGYYLLSFEPEPSERDGKSHKIKVSIGRRGLTVRARREFSVDPPPDAASLATRLGEALVSPIDLTDIGLRVAPFVLRDDSGRLKVIITSQIDRTALPPGDGTFGYMLIDRQGRLAGSDVEPSLGPQDRHVQQLTSALVVDPGIYSLRAAAVDASGREGSVGYTFEARLQAAGQLQWSDLVLSEQHPETQRLELLTDGPEGPTLQAYLELYSEVQPMLDTTSVVVEISRREDGLTLVSAPLTFSASQTPDRRTGEARLDVGLLGHGDFLARAIIKMNGKEVGRTLRPFAIKRQP